MTTSHDTAAPARRILMTRAAPDCARWQAQLHPFAATITYLAPFDTQPVPLPPEVVDALLTACSDDATAWVVTSPRALAAVQATAPHLAAQLRQRITFAVGEGTADSLRGAGFSRVIAAEGDLASLASLVSLQAPRQGVMRVIHLAGQVTVGDLAEQLRGIDLQVEKYIVYDAALNAVPAEIAQDMASGAITDIVLLSARVASHLGAAVVPLAGETMPLTGGPQRLYCLSPRIADAARAGFAPFTPELVVAPRPDIGTLLTMIDAPVAGLHNR